MSTATKTPAPEPKRRHIPRYVWLSNATFGRKGNRAHSTQLHFQTRRVRFDAEVTRWDDRAVSGATHLQIGVHHYTPLIDLTFQLPLFGGK